MRTSALRRNHARWTLNNIGPGFGLVGPTQSFRGFTVFSKLVFSLLM